MFSLDWERPLALIGIPLAAILLAWWDAKSIHPMGGWRKRALLLVRSTLVALLFVAIASPARTERNSARSVIFGIDFSESMGEGGAKRALDRAEEIWASLPSSVSVGAIAVGERPKILFAPSSGEKPAALKKLAAERAADHSAEKEFISGARSDFQSAFELSQALFPADAARHFVLISDGLENAGDLRGSVSRAAHEGARTHVAPIAGEARPDARVSRLESDKSRVNEGASFILSATLESSVSGEALLRLFENGLEAERRTVQLKAGETIVEKFRRSPQKRNVYAYRATLENVPDDELPANNEALAIVDVRGKPLLLHIEGEPGQERYLVEAMAREGLRLDARPASGLPQTAQELAAYDAVILSDVPASDLNEQAMTALRTYVETLGGGFVMIGGANSFGVGGYHRTPIEEILPVKLKPPDQEERHSSALALVIDRSGSMSGQKIELCKAAAAATAELLGKKDYLGVYAFDSQVHIVVPMARLRSASAVAAQISTLNAGGGTFIQPGMVQARADLNKTRAKIKHMIVLTDGQTTGSGYEALAAQCRAEGVTISTVAVGSGAQVGLLQAIASAGGGKAYVTMDPKSLTRIFTQDAMTHTGKMIREEAFEARQNERHPMLGSAKFSAPPLLGYVKTIRRGAAQAPLVTDIGDPLLAHWRYGLGKATAFTSDAKSRWAALWISGWPGYSSFWSQVLRETARAPQGLNMDLRVEPGPEKARLEVDLLENALQRRHGAEVLADVYHTPPGALGAALGKPETVVLRQRGPGLYAAEIPARKPGLYLVRAREGARMVSAGFARNPSSETAAGLIDEDFLSEVAKLGGGAFLKLENNDLPVNDLAAVRHRALWQPIVLLALGLFLIDLLIRRWEHLLGAFETIGEFLRGGRQKGA